MTVAATTEKTTYKYYAVLGGHLHHEGCGHMRRRGSRRVRLDNLDGMPSNEVVEQHGEYCCSHCFPHEGARKQKIDSNSMDKINGMSARRQALAAEHARKAEPRSDPLLVALTAAFELASDCGNHDIEVAIYHARAARERDLGL